MVSQSLLASSKFMKEIFVQCLVLVFGASGEEDVSTNVLVDHLAVTAYTGEGQRHILVKVNGHLEQERNSSHLFTPNCNHTDMNTTQ